MSEVTSVNTKATAKTTAGALNAGNPMKTVMPSVGKLSFCLPHVHGLSDINSVNIGAGLKGDTDTASGEKVIYPYILQDGDMDCWTNGTAATPYMHNWPVYNMSLIKKKMKQEL
mgnify:FL=1